MSSKKTARHRGSIISNTLLSGFAAILFEGVLLANTSSIDKLLTRLGYQTTLTSLAGSYEMAIIGLYLFMGIFVFAVVFAMLQYKNIQYLRRISVVLQDVAEGNFNRKVPVTGDDELSEIALKLNHMTEEICQLMEREKEAEQTKNDLITNVAHDLRTPLTSIIGYLDLIRKRSDLSEQTKQDYLKIAYDKSKHLQDLIEDLFGLTKLGYGQKTAQLQPLDMVELLGQLLEEFYPVMENNKMEYEYIPHMHSQMILGDGMLLARLFDNLLNNAVKYGKEGKRIIVETMQKENMVYVSVTNFGKVIPQKDLEHIFDKFYRAEQSRSSSTGGTGLGLAIAKNIVMLHGGQIYAKSSLEGTVFEVELPIMEKEAET